MSKADINKFKTLPAFCRRLRVGLVALDCIIGLVICQAVLLSFLYGARAVDGQMRRCRTEKVRTLAAYRFLFGPRGGDGATIATIPASIALSQNGVIREQDVVSLEVLHAETPRSMLIRC